MESINAWRAMLCTEDHSASDAERTVLALIDQFLDSATEDITDDFMNEFVKWTSLYFMYRMDECGEEPRRREEIVFLAAHLSSPALSSRRATIEDLTKRFLCTRAFPSSPQDLFTEYYDGIRTQRAQYNAQYDLAEDATSALGLAPLPILEQDKRRGFYDGMLCVSPSLGGDIVRSIIAHISKQTITLLLSRVTLRLRLSNPLPLPENVISGYTCDSCSRRSITVAFQATSPGNVRSTVSLYDDCRGYDMCITCVVYFVHKLLLRLRPAFTAPPSLSRRFIAHNAKLHLHSATHSGTFVQLRASIAPQSARLCVWEIPATRHSNEEEPWSLPLPPRDWSEMCHVRSAAPKTVHGTDDICAVCLCPLSESDENGAVLETACGHTFHAYCLERTQLMPTGPKCPLCRSPAYHEYMTECCTYNAELTLRECQSLAVEENSVESKCLDCTLSVTSVGVAVLLTNQYTNPTNIVACEVIRLYPGSLMSREFQSTHTGMEVLPFFNTS